MNSIRDDKGILIDASLATMLCTSRGYSHLVNRKGWDYKFGYGFHRWFSLFCILFKLIFISKIFLLLLLRVSFLFLVIVIAFLFFLFNNILLHGWSMCVHLVLIDEVNVFFRGLTCLISLLHIEDCGRVCTLMS